jgi:hypothetical protein
VPRKNTPRIFVAFPLTATRAFCLPAVVNNEKFQPREDRDTLYLRPAKGVKHPNMPLDERCLPDGHRPWIFSRTILPAACTRSVAVTIPHVGEILPIPGPDGIRVKAAEAWPRVAVRGATLAHRPENRRNSLTLSIRPTHRLTRLSRSRAKTGKTL